VGVPVEEEVGFVRRLVDCGVGERGKEREREGGRERKGGREDGMRREGARGFSS